MGLLLPLVGVLAVLLSLSEGLDGFVGLVGRVLLLLLLLLSLEGSSVVVGVREIAGDKSRLGVGGVLKEEGGSRSSIDEVSVCYCAGSGFSSLVLLLLSSLVFSSFSSFSGIF